MKVIAGLAFLLSATAAYAAEPITGPANVIESDVLEINGTRILLWGLESIEPRQTCEINRQMWECWAAAVRELQTIVSEGDLTCTPMRDPDPHGRILATCTVNGEDLGARYVKSGFAVALAHETEDYVALEKEARKAKVGLWQGRFDRPRDWRTAHGIFVDRP